MSQSSHHQHDQETYTKTVFGFWIYLMTDFMMFAALFATFIVLRHNFFGGPPPKELFHLPYTFVQTAFLLLASFASGVGGAFAHRGNKRGTLMAFGLTFLLGLVFFAMQTHEFLSLINSGNGWQRSAYLSAFFTLAGTQWMHMIIALLWVVLLLIPVIREGITPVSVKRLTCLRIFWQFLYVIWIFIFACVYLMGVY
ncbi:MAG: cytochrome c oxidase subunit 3 [Chlamydiia bacterium]|nr:cytochrome c oxidase subunit 3 [Chlamydiia bacterium]MCP5510031.1 cytochrome c oxidase subunit 3 [Chlamydiales bacterium]